MNDSSEDSYWVIMTRDKVATMIWSEHKNILGSAGWKEGRRIPSRTNYNVVTSTFKRFLKENGLTKISHDYRP